MQRVVSNGSPRSAIHKYSWENNMASIVVVVYMVQLILHHISPSGGSSHWVVTEDGRIQAQVLSALPEMNLLPYVGFILECQRSWHFDVGWQRTRESKDRSLSRYAQIRWHTILLMATLSIYEDPMIKKV